MMKFLAKRFVTVLLTIFLTSSVAGAWGQAEIKCKNPQAQKIADQIYNMLVRELSPQTYTKSIELLKKAIEIEPDNDLLWIELASSYLEYGDKLPKKTRQEKKIRLAIFNKGIAAAEKAIEIRDSAGGHYWYAINLAASGEMKGIMSSLWMFRPLMKHMKRSEELDPDYLLGGSARFWTEVISRVPDAALKAVGQKLDQELEPMLKQIEKHPYYFVNYIFCARYLMRLKRRDDALEKLEFVLKTDPKSAPDRNLHSANVTAQKDALVEWKNFTGKNYPAR